MPSSQKGEANAYVKHIFDGTESIGKQLKLERPHYDANALSSLVSAYVIQCAGRFYNHAPSIYNHYEKSAAEAAVCSQGGLELATKLNKMVNAKELQARDFMTAGLGFVGLHRTIQWIVVSRRRTQGMLDETVEAYVEDLVKPMLLQSRALPPKK